MHLWAFGAVGDPRYDLTLALYGLSTQERSAFFDGYGEPDHLSQSEFDYFLKLAMFY